MAHHAYFFAGDREAGIRHALAFGERVLGLPPSANPDIIIERHGLFTVDDSRRIAVKAGFAPVSGKEKMIIIAASRLFHEAQNALLKLFEEPPLGTTLVLVVPSEGDLIYTLRSRLQPLPETGEDPDMIPEETRLFTEGNEAVRAKLVAGILDEAKSDKDEEKQEARAKALRLVEGLSRAGYRAWRASETPDMENFLRDLDRLIPILHDRAAPLKPILEHLLITAPTKLG